MPVLLQKWKAQKDFYENSLIFFFLAGIAAGTAITYLFREQIPETLIGVEEADRFLRLCYDREMIKAVAGQRLLEVIFGWLVGMTSFSAMAYRGIAAYTGLSLSLILCMFTMKKGLAGLVFYICTVFPHCIIYGVIWAVLAVWAGKKPARPRLFPFLLLLALTVFGGFAEAVISPELMGILL